MADTNELKKIKKMYGENFMKLCRELFPIILEQDGKLYEILTSTFSENCKSLYDEIINREIEEEFKNLIYSKFDVEENEIKLVEKKTPYELLDEAGYDLFECKTEEEIQQFRKYYAENEELCTFRHGDRLDRCVVFFAVRKDVENIKREDFEKPKREDEYGTSVMGIQFTKNGKSTVSIKNRYNHRVNNPDATYGNNLDNIIPGLSESFEQLLQERGLQFDDSNIEKFEIPGYVVASDGKYYKYNREINGIYYCPGNIVIENGEPKKLENPEKQMLLDYFVIDSEKKEIKLYDEKIKDSFIDGIKNIENIQVTKDKEKGTRKILIKTSDQEEPIIIEIDKDNLIIGYENKELKEVGDNFLGYNKNLKTLNLPELEQTGNYFLYRNENLTTSNLSKLEQTGDGFLSQNISLSVLDLPNLKIVGDSFLLNNKNIKTLNLPELEEAGKDFFVRNEVIELLDLPNLKKADKYFLTSNKSLSILNLPNLQIAGDEFLAHNEIITTVYLPELQKIGYNFLVRNKNIISLELPKLEESDINFLYFDENLKILKLPNLKKTGSNFLYYNKNLLTLEAENLEEAGDNFLKYNTTLKILNLPQIKKTGKSFLNNNESMIKLITPMLEEYDSEDLKRLKQVCKKNKKEIDSSEIAKLDKESNLTTSELNGAQKIIQKIKEKFKGWIK